MNDEELQEILSVRHGIKMSLFKTNRVNNLIRGTLRDYDIGDIEEFEKPNVELTSSENFINMDSMLTLNQDLKKGSKVYTLVDSDVDGYTSSALIVNYFKKRYPNNLIEMIIPDTKIHGINGNFDSIPDDCQDLIAPDSSSNDFSALHKLKDINVKVFVIDHHNIENEEIASKYNIINNTWKTNDYVNDHYTGVGMVYKCLEYLDDNYFGDKLANSFLDLVALGQIGDMEDVSDLEIRTLMIGGFKHINNKFLKEYFSGDDEKPSPKHFAFSLIPKINATTRIGEHIDRQLLMNALTENENETFDVVKRKKNHETGKFDKHEIKQNIYEYVKDRIIKTKSKQDRIVKKAVNELTYLSSVDDPMNVAVLDNKYNKGLTGLIANKLLGDTKKPSFVLIPHKDKNALKGSMRTPMMYQHAKEDLVSVDGIEYVLGHENAAGIGIDIDKVESVIYEMSILFKKSNDFVYKINAVYFNSTPSTKDCKDVQNHLDLFGGRVKEPLVGMIGLKVQKKDIYIKNNLFKININGIELVQFSASQEFIDGIQNNFKSEFCFDAIGTLGVNTWLGRISPQIILDDIVFSDPIRDRPVSKEELVF